MRRLVVEGAPKPPSPSLAFAEDCLSTIINEAAVSNVHVHEIVIDETSFEQLVASIEQRTGKPRPSGFNAMQRATAQDTVVKIATAQGHTVVKAFRGATTRGGWALTAETLNALGDVSLSQIAADYGLSRGDATPTIINGETFRGPESDQHFRARILAAALTPSWTGSPGATSG